MIRIETHAAAGLSPSRPDRASVRTFARAARALGVRSRVGADRGAVRAASSARLRRARNASQSCSFASVTDEQVRSFGCDQRADDDGNR